MTLTTLIASVGFLAALQAAYLYLRSMEARTAGGPGMWATIEDDEFDLSDDEKHARDMKKKFEIARAKAIMGMAEEFAVRKSNA